MIMTPARQTRENVHFEQSCKYKDHEVIIAKYNVNPSLLCIHYQKQKVFQKIILLSIKRFINKLLQVCM